MPEKNSTDTKEFFCSCDNCRMPGMYSHRKFFLARLILGLGILFITFCIGFKLGEFKAEFVTGGGFGEHGYGLRHDMMYFNPMGGGTFNQMVPPKGSATVPMGTTGGNAVK